MFSNSLKKFAVIFLILGQLMLPVLVFAAVNPVPVNDNGSTIENTAFNIAMTPIKLADVACSELEAAYEKIDSGAQLGFSGLSVIGGDAVLLGKLADKITDYNGFITCRQKVLTSLNNLVTPNSYTYAQKQQYIVQENAAINTYKAKLETTQARYNNAKQGFWKTLVFNILVKTSKAVADSLVTKLVNNFKIRDIKQYADSVATLVYDNQFIRENNPSAQGQLMARAILENPQLRYRVPSTIFVAADAALGFDPKALDPNDPNFYTKMASVGSSQANPYFQHSVYIGGVDQSHALALAYSQNQISQSNGYKTPVNCAGTLVMQKQIDAKAKALSDQLADRKNLFDSLQNAEERGSYVPREESDRAYADYLAAKAAWNNAPDAVMTASGSTSTAPAIVMCEAIASPVALVNQGIDSVIKAVGGNITQYNDNNLPAFMNIIGNVASQIGSSLIFGGAKGAVNAARINEGKLVTAAVTAGGEAAYNQASTNLAKGIIFDEPTANGPNSYTLDWEIVKEQLPSASFVTIYGNGISATITNPTTGQTTPNRLPLNGSRQITLVPVPNTANPGTFISSYNYILTVFDQSGRAITSATVTIDISSPAIAFNPAGAITQVLGAFTQHHFQNSESGAGFISKPALDIRGPSVVISPR